MKRHVTVAVVMLAALLTACHKKDKPEDTPVVAAPTPLPAAAPATSATPATPASSAELTPEQREQAKKKALLEYGVTEDKYLNDARAQWATEAKASSVLSDSDSSAATNATGPSDSKIWSNKNRDQGFDWIELGYATPVNATEVRVVIPYGQGVEAINKVELQDTDGKWNTVWEGINDVKRDERGDRTWFVRTFSKTAYKAKAVKLTYANNLQHDIKLVDAVQLVGDK
jgi:hypothetical protein